MGNHRTITIMGEPVRKEAIANAAITPGHLIYELSTGKVAVHAVSGGNAQTMFALEDELQGKEISQAYSSGDQVLYGVFRRGDEVNALLANGQNVAIGAALESNGDGTLKAHTPVDLEDSDPGDSYTRSIVGYAKEAVDMSGSSGEDPSGRIRVEIA
jgi:hypothetical protein